MIDTMHEYHGVGLAAPQVHEGCACSSRRLTSARTRTTTTEDAEPIALINPEIMPVGGDVVEEWEGCLSIPDIRGTGAASARDHRAGARSRRRARRARAADFPARVIQHETDHLDGVLFFDRMKSIDSLTFLDEYSRFWTKHSMTIRRHRWRPRHRPRDRAGVRRARTPRGDCGANARAARRDGGGDSRQRRRRAGRCRLDVTDERVGRSAFAELRRTSGRDRRAREQRRRRRRRADRPDSDTASWRRIVDTNVSGTYLVTRRPRR